MPTKEHKGAGHRKRLREKFLKTGLAGFLDYEIIELLLTIATPRKDTKDIAKDAIKRFKTLQGVLNASSEELQQVKGIGPTNLFGIKLVKSVAERYAENKIIKSNPITCSEDLYNYLQQTIRDKSRERFLSVFLDSKNRIINVKTLFEGSLNHSFVYPREVVKEALLNNAAAIVFAHNHPSGDPEPSPEDKRVTKDLIDACRLVGIVVHEHIIVGSHDYYSFADNGIIRQLSQEYIRS